MGLVTMDKDITEQNGALGLDLQSKCGMLVKEEVGKYVNGKYQDARRIYFVGGAKTADLIEKCEFNLTHNPAVAADKAKLEELDIFVNALQRLHIKPGDWHAGLTMLQSIMNTFWDGFLQLLIKKLGWNRV